jgi:hypothetical protein
METPKLSPRDVIARSYPGWDADLADRLIKWLDHCGYAIVEKSHGHDQTTLEPATAAQQQQTQQ